MIQLGIKVIKISIKFANDIFTNVYPWKLLKNVRDFEMGLFSAYVQLISTNSLGNSF